MKLISDGGMVCCNTHDTIDAIMLTKNLSYVDGVKLDVRLTKDDYLVLSKYDDLSIDTLSNKKVSECCYNYLRKVKFPTHIFKYYIPTLEEILNHYNHEKIIVLELYPYNIDTLLEKLKSLLLLYDYSYYFISDSNEVLEKLKQNDFHKIGIIVNQESDIKVMKDLKMDEEILIDNDVLLITKNPEKIRKKLIFFDK